LTYTCECVHLKAAKYSSNGKHLVDGNLLSKDQWCK
jgi:hypothetical protein